MTWDGMDRRGPALTEHDLEWAGILRAQPKDVASHRRECIMVERCKIWRALRAAGFTPKPSKRLEEVLGALDLGDVDEWP